ncbi:hypothetical protein MES4922_210159 [Mesorhizobium ventifaucium]|uniref:Uncharacterized protein n=1 Tax=Mesorhizobium ventifaucium TaxID=666020 RepID=A0ABN8JM88_9HYPH|nr:hypothetical protein MES4922_210159 [Mesorhizobium ventifaucium]
MIGHGPAKSAALFGFAILPYGLLNTFAY